MSETGARTQMEHAPGSFCWAELATTDGPGAKKFYGELFGWEALDSPVGPGMVYTMLKLHPCGRLISDGGWPAIAVNLRARGLSRRAIDPSSPQV